MTAIAIPTHWPKVAASIAVFRDGRVLIVERAKPPLSGVWSLPGGHIEAGEPAAQAALRELAEETAIEAEIAGVAGIREVIRRDAQGKIEAHYVIVVHAGLWRAGEPIARSDVSDARFVQSAEISHYRTTDGLADAIRRAEMLLMRPAAP
ncbi:MAG: NUDIX hydrolase [Hyphomicrobiaceae bacterium]